MVLVVTALLVPVAAMLALGVRHDEAIERMIVDSDPDHAATRAFLRAFPEPKSVLLLLEVDDPFAPEALSRLKALEASCGRVPKVMPYSALSVAARLRPGLSPSGLRELLTGTSFFRKQGLLGDRFLGLALVLDVDDASSRDATLGAIEAVLAKLPPAPGRLRKVGTPLVDAWLEHQTRDSSVRYFPLFGLFVVILNLALFRSVRALATILLTLGVCVLFGFAAAGVMGFTQTIVSSLVPLTLLVTATASLIYLHARFVDRPAEVPVEEHRTFALANKLLPVTASIFAAAVGFAALSVSKIRPVREMGIWTSIGLVLTWVVCFTVYPALQRVLKAPTRGEIRLVAGDWVRWAAAVIPRWSYRLRWPLVTFALVLSAAGAAAILGVPGLLAPMPLEVEGLSYIPRQLPLVEDARWFEANVAGLRSFSLWVTTPPGSVLEPAVLSGLDAFGETLESDPRIRAVTGLTSVLRLRRWASGLRQPPEEGSDSLFSATAELEQLVLSEEGLRSFVDMQTLGATRMTVLTAPGGVPLTGLSSAIQRAWVKTAEAHPALAGCSVRLVGQGVLAEKIAGYLVPTLVESFGLTAGIIFLTFFLVFRSPAARLMAMVPSLFAILTMFLAMRIFGVPLNIVTILIATTVLGASENDQVHFFYHFQERRRTGSTEEAMAHAIRVAGSAIFFATLVNAGGFLALALADLPALKQFGTLSATAFALSMLADFTALPAALWIVFRERPSGSGPDPAAVGSR